MHITFFSFGSNPNFVDVLSILVTVLIGWNIYQVIDLRLNQKRFNRIKREFNKMHNDIDYWQGIARSSCVLILAGSLSNEANEIQKFQMLLHASIAVKTLSNLESFSECRSIVSTVTSTLKRCEDVELAAEEWLKIRETFYEIPNANKIEGLKELIFYIETKVRNSNPA